LATVEGTRSRNKHPENNGGEEMKALGLALAILIVVMLPMAAAAQESDKDIVVDLVDKSVAMFKQKGKDQTLKTLNSPAGPLRRGALYAFAVTFKGQMLSHPTQEDLRGKDTWELQDAKGKFIIQDFIKVARDQGQGWYEYSWIRVGETTPRMKRTYIKRVPGEDIFVGAGYYIK
jgi:cytochrome c